MRGRNALVRSRAGVGLLIACVAAWGCGSGGAATDSSELVELRTYNVAPEYQDDLRFMLQSALGAGDNPLGQVTNGPNGTLLVAAPRRIQVGVQEVLDSDVEPIPAASPITLTYWMLVGRPVAESGAEPFTFVGDRRIPRLEAVLREIATAQGPTEFSLLEQIQVTSMSQQSAEATGRFGVTQRATRSGAQVVADVEIGLAASSNAFQSRVVLDAGQFLVLGRTGFTGSALYRGFPDPGIDASLYYVIAADVEP